MATFLYVHGIGNRSVAVNQILGKLEERIRADLPGKHNIDFCAWGTHLGTAHRPGGFRSIPGYANRGGGQADPNVEVEEEVNLWGLLYRDPLFELKLLAVLPQVPVKSGGAFGGAP